MRWATYDREIVDTDDWALGTIISKDGTTDYKIIRKRKLRKVQAYRYGLELIKSCVICQKQKPTDFDGYCQECHDEIAERNVRLGTVTQNQSKEAKTE